MGNANSNISQKIDDAKVKLRLAQQIRTFSKLERDVKLLSLICRHAFIDPRTQTCMQFSIWTKLSPAELLLPLLWRGDGAVLIQVDWKFVDVNEQSVSISEQDAIEYHEYKSNTTLVAPRVLTVNDFYVLFVYVQSHRELIVQAQNKLKALRTQAELSVSNATPIPEPVDNEDSTCSICLHRAVDSVVACGHGMCSVCLREWREASQPEITAECPFCRAQLEDAEEDWEVTPQSSEEITEQLQSVAVHANSIAIERGRLVGRMVDGVEMPAQSQQELDGI